MTGAPPVGSHPWRPRAWYIVKGVRMEMMHMSPALPRLLGCEPADLTGTKMTDLLHPEVCALTRFSSFPRRLFTGSLISRSARWRRRTILLS